MVFGVSLDDPASHRKFCDSLALSFPLLADTGGRAARSFGVFVDQYGGIAKRSMFAIDEAGKVEYVDESYDLKTSADFDALIAALGPTQAGAGKEDEEPLATELFSVDEYREDLEILASDEFEGRGINTRAERKTVEYLSEQLTKAGFSPGHGASFAQPVPLVSIAHTETSKLAFGDTALKRLDDFVVGTKRQQESLDAAGELVFAGYGCVAPEYRWDDFKGVDCTGKVLVVLVNDPPSVEGQ